MAEITSTRTVPGPLDLGFRCVDADNHYYEAQDAFTRHLDRKLGRRAVQWAEVNGRRRLLVGGKLDHFIPNPTFDPVAKPGSLDAYFRARNPSGKSMAELFGELEPIRPEYRDRDARLVRLDAQQVEAALLFPTLGVGIEEPLRHDAEATCAALHAFNQWLDEDWGFAYRERLFAVPMLSLADPVRAVEMLEWCLARGARAVHLRPAPVPGVPHSRSPGDPLFDPSWARALEAGIVVAFHAGDSGYGRYLAEWEARGQMEAFRSTAFTVVSGGDRPIYDTIAALVCHGVFARFPRLRIASIENGSEWMAPLARKLTKAFGQMPKAFAEPPLDTLRRHLFVAPYYEDDIHRLSETIGVERVLLGSDWPHAEGIAEPTHFLHDLEGFPPEAVRRIMRENGAALLRPAQGAAA